MVRKVRTQRTRSKASAVSSKKTKAGKTGSVFKIGAEGRKNVNREIKRQANKRAANDSQRGQPFRIWIRPGESKKVIILDDKPEFFMYEHQGKNPQTGKWGFHVPCIKEVANCPGCETFEKDSYYAMFLSVIDLSKFEDRNGKVHKFSRKLMCIKSGQQKKFLRRFERSGTLRGQVVILNRDGEKDPVIGNDFEFLEMKDESALSSKKYTRKYKDAKGKVHVEDCSQPYTYTDVFQEPTEDSLRELLGADASPGSMREAEEELDEDDDDDWEEEDEDEDEVPWDEEEDEDEDEDETEEDEDEDEDELGPEDIEKGMEVSLIVQGKKNPVEGEVEKISSVSVTIDGKRILKSKIETVELLEEEEAEEDEDEDDLEEEELEEEELDEDEDEEEEERSAKAKRRTAAKGKSKATTAKAGKASKSRAVRRPKRG